MEGRIQKTTLEGESTVESLDPDTVHKLLHYLDLTNQVTSRTELRQPLQCFRSSCRRCYCAKSLPGGRFRHAGGEEEPAGQRALPLPSASGGRLGADRPVPCQEAGEDDQKRASCQVSVLTQHY